MLYFDGCCWLPESHRPEPGFVWTGSLWVPKGTAYGPANDFERLLMRETEATIREMNAMAHFRPIKFNVIRFWGGPSDAKLAEQGYEATCAVEAAVHIANWGSE